MTAPLLLAVVTIAVLLIVVTGHLGGDWLRWMTDIATHGPMPVTV